MKLISCLLLPLLVILCSFFDTNIANNNKKYASLRDTSFNGLVMADLIEEKRKTGYSVNHCSSESFGMTYSELSYKRSVIRLTIILYSKTPFPSSLYIKVSPFFPDRNCFIKDPPKPERKSQTTIRKIHKLVFDYILINPTSCEIGDAAGNVATLELKEHNYDTGIKWFAFRNFSSK